MSQKSQWPEKHNELFKKLKRKSYQDKALEEIQDLISFGRSKGVDSKLTLDQKMNGIDILTNLILDNDVFNRYTVSKTIGNSLHKLSFSNENISLEERYYKSIDMKISSIEITSTADERKEKYEAFAILLSQVSRD